MTTLLSYKTTLAYLAYLGYPHEDTTTALNVIRPRKREPARFGGSGPQRNVFLCYVLGAAGSGKVSESSILGFERGSRKIYIE
jgi:Ras family protein T1